MPAPGYRAMHRNAMISPRKTRLVADMIRGKRVPEATQILAFTDKRAAAFLRKVLASATANAGQADVDAERLVVSAVLINEGPRLKRMFPRPRGTATPINRPMCHIFVELRETEAQVPVGSAVPPAPSAPEKT